MLSSRTCRLSTNDTLSSATVLQTVAVLIRKDCRKQTILSLPKDEVDQDLAESR